LAWEVLSPNTSKTISGNSNGGRAASQSTFSPTFNIYQKDGEDSEALAKRIMKMIKDMNDIDGRSDYEDDF